MQTNKTDNTGCEAAILCALGCGSFLFFLPVLVWIWNVLQFIGSVLGIFALFLLFGFIVQWVVQLFWFY